MMRRILATSLLGLCLLTGTVLPVFAQNSQGPNGNNQGPNDNNQGHSAPEIDMGAATGALAIAAGALMLLRERLRRPSA